MRRIREPVPDDKVGDPVIKAIAYKTVDTFAGITSRKLWLKNGPAPTTTGWEIVAPFTSPDFYLMVERLLGHILFRTDPAAQRLFVTESTERTVKGLAKAERTIDAKAFATAITTIVNALEQYRVVNLWGELYEGSAARMAEVDRTALRGKLKDLLERRDDQEPASASLLRYIHAYTVAPDMARTIAGPYAKLEPVLEKALSKIKGRGFKATLLVSRWLINQLVDLLAEDMPPPLPGTSPQPHASPNKSQQPQPPPSGAGAPKTPPPVQDPPKEKDKQEKKQEKQESQSPQSSAQASQQDQAAKFEDFAANHLQNPPNAPSYVSEAGNGQFTAEASKELAQNVLKTPVNSEKFEKELEQTRTEMQKILDKVRETVRQTPQQGEWLQKNAMAKLKLDPVPPAAKPRPLSETDLDTVRRLRAIFQRVAGARKTRLEDVGSEVDVTAWLERRVSRQQVPCFKTEVTGRGFRVMLLLDQSGSMRGQGKIEALNRASAIIQRALKFPFVTLEIWGFTSKAPGEVTLNRFDPKSPLDIQAESNGSTPLHTAIRVAARNLQVGTETKQLIVLTDGFPSYQLRNGNRVSTGALMNFVKQEVLAARRRAINVTGVLLGNEPTKNQRGLAARGAFDLGPEELKYMFGAQRNWRCMTPANLSTELVNLVSTSFMRFLKFA